MAITIRGLVFLTSALALALAACDGGADSLTGAPAENPVVDGQGPGVDPIAPVSCSTRGTKYTGFGKADLGSDRVEALAGADRGRLKPYSALSPEIKRVTGQSPASLNAASSTYGTPQDRWFGEPIASAISVATTFNVAFEACRGVTKDAAEYAAAPTAASAAAVCSTLARKFWSRTPAEDEIAACAQVALTDTAAESDPRRRWAYACAGVLSSSGFMSY